MAFDAHKNFAFSTIATAPSPATSGTSLVVQSGDGTRFPAASFNATIWPTNALPTAANSEIVRVTNVSTDTFTITRTQESTSARSINVGDMIAAGITAKTVTDIENKSTQTDNSNSIANTTSSLNMQFGWGQMLGSGAAKTTETVTFPSAFTTVLGVQISMLGFKATPAATDITGLVGDYGTIYQVYATTITTSNFKAEIDITSGTMSNTVYFGYAWIAWGI